MRLHRAPGHLELSGNLRIVATLKQQLGDLLFARTQPNRALVHFGFPLGLMIPARFGQLLIEVACARRRLRHPGHFVPQTFLGSPKIHSMHTAKLAVNFPFQLEI